VEGAEATVRVFVFFQEDGAMNDRGHSASAFSRKLLVNGTRRDVSVYQLNGEHGTSMLPRGTRSMVGVWCGCSSAALRMLSATPMTSRTNTGSVTAYSEFLNTSGVSVYGCKSEGSGAIIMVSYLSLYPLVTARIYILFLYKYFPEVYSFVIQSVCDI
jgi:hypothetical protein